MDNQVDSEGSTAGTTALEIASVRQRISAGLVDAVIGILIGVVGGALGSVIGGAAGWLLVFMLVSVLVIAYVVVYLWLVSTRGQSPGKMAIGIKIVKMDGSAIGIGGALIREIIGKLVSSIFYLGYIWILFDGKRQGWHDKIAGTIVVKA